MQRLHSYFLFAIAALGVMVFTIPTYGTNLVSNGDFETTVPTSSFGLAAGNTTNLPGWSVDKGLLPCVVFPGSASTNACGNGSTLWPTVSSPSGNFFSMDGDPAYTGTLSQTITGLTVNDSYVVSFDQAAAQYQFFNGATTEQWLVSFGSSSQSSTLMNNASHGFVPWMHQSLTFTASATTQVLGFFAVGTPGGLPPVVLLDNVSVQAAPEPGSIALMGIGAAALVGARRFLKRS